MSSRFRIAGVNRRADLLGLAAVWLVERLLNDLGRMTPAFRIPRVLKAFKGWYIYARDSWGFQNRSSSHPAEGKYAVQRVTSRLAVPPTSTNSAWLILGSFFRFQILPSPSQSISCSRNAGLILRCWLIAFTPSRVDLERGVSFWGRDRFSAFCSFW